MAPPHTNGFSASSTSTSFNPAADLYPPRPPPDMTDSGEDCYPVFFNVLRLLARYLLRKALAATTIIVSVLLTGSSRTARIVLRSSRSDVETSTHNAHRRRQARPWVMADMVLRLLRHQLAPQRVFSISHGLIAAWVLVLLWGERWNFHASISRCQWDYWEKWPSGATPHHLIFVADPQIVDAHTYPGRPWPLSALTITLTDNYMRRSYLELQEQLFPDTVMFLGDLFDGGREWRPLHGSFDEPAWSDRPTREQGYAKMWRKKYDESYWLREYGRFSDIFLRPKTSKGWMSYGGEGDGEDGSEVDDRMAGEPRGRRLVASLPGNHDLGFGAGVQLSVRNRFQSYFGESNRVDVIGNHTFVSVDTVSFSAGSSDKATLEQMRPIFEPSQTFLADISWAKKKAVARELRYQRGLNEGVSFAHTVRELTNTTQLDHQGLHKKIAAIEGADEPADLPTVLLSHVPLYRPPGTPCGPQREHWPPTKPTSANGAIAPSDERNAITVARGYQYQNVLGESDSIRLVQTIGNVVHAFSGDDHDYCHVVHDAQQLHVPEITVKSFSMAMGVPTPGFLMVSLYNPIDGQGHTLSSSKAATMQTHLCLLPNQLATYARYGGMATVSIVLLAIYAILVPIIGLPVFAFDPDADDGNSSSASHCGGGGGGGMVSGSDSFSDGSGALLPLYGKAKVQDDEYGRRGALSSAEKDIGSGYDGAGASSDSSGFIAFQAPASSRGRSNPGQPLAQAHTQPRRSNSRRHGGKSSRSRGAAPRIQITHEDDSHDSYDSDDNGYGGRDYHGVIHEDYMDDVQLGDGGSGAANRWRPAGRRGTWGLGWHALAMVRQLVFSASGSRSTSFYGGNRRRRTGAGGIGSGTAAWFWSLVRRVGTSGGRRRRATLGISGSGGSGNSRRMSSRRLLWTAGWELYVMMFRVGWVVMACWCWLNHKG